ncbi:MAG TPA: Xaa-Pro peptidase family protein [Candidatus Tetragenococcus pullicola]|nr:Xaa-Pro peptidase family protein [Candidatus Tetragenococcus pullicola]
MSRITKLREEMNAIGVDSFLITSPYNLRYFTNFTGTPGDAVALITNEKAFFITDFRYLEQAREQATEFELVEGRNYLQTATQVIKEQGLQDVAFEEDYISFAQFDLLQDWVEDVWVPVSEVLESLREIKDDNEIATIKKACQIADQGFDHVLKMIQPGMTEIEVANQLDFFMRSLGATGVSFETIVASGTRSSMPHGVASQKVIEQGDIVTLDFGCYYNGYVSDMTRTFAIGDPGEKMKEIYQIVLDANLKVIEAAKAGVSGIELDTVAREHIASFGYGEAFGHSTGHGIGLEIHEGPNVSARADKKFVVGNIITDEPGIYLPEIGGVRIEDDLLITENGCEVLTSSPKELIIL